MRLIRLKVRNIASLKGEHEIDFTEIQRVSSLFAITGETGSGKSSILNSIGLALYGQIYKKNVNQLDVVTLGEKDGSIELIFQVKDKFYLADWRARVLKQNGEPYATPQTPQRVLYEVEGDTFSSPKTASEKNTTELLNLDFDQFCKCIILNQGEFAKFLSSSFSERKDILEKLYPGEMLDNISRELDSEKKALEKVKHDIEIELQAIKGDVSPEMDLVSDKKILEEALKKYESIFSQFEKFDYHFVSLFSYFEKYGDNNKKISLLQSDITSVTTRYNHLLKKGEEISERFQIAQKEQEKNLPILEKLLRSEESLKNLEESLRLLLVKEEKLSRDQELIKEKLSSKSGEEEKLKTELKTLEENLHSSVTELKKHRDVLTELFDLFSEKEVLETEIKGKTENLLQFENNGKELKALTEKLESDIKLMPADTLKTEKEVLTKKATLQAQIDKKQRAIISSEELKKQVTLLSQDFKTSTDKVKELEFTINRTREEIFPLETTLKLQEVLNATEVCLDHALTSNAETCPVCEGVVPETKWQKLKSKLLETDLKSLRVKFENLSNLVFKSEKEKDLLEERIKKVHQDLDLKNKELADYVSLITLELPSMVDVENELDSIRKKSLELQSLEKELKLKALELQKIREHYISLKTQITEREKLLKLKDDKLTELHGSVSVLIKEINKDTVRELKSELRTFDQYREFEKNLDKVSQDKTHLDENLKKMNSDLKVLHIEKDDHSSRIKSLSQELATELKGEKASALIQKINLLVKSTGEEWARHREEQHKEDQEIKKLQGRLTQLEELKKDYDVQFSNERLKLQELARAYTHESQLIQKLRNLSLTLSSESELFIPLRDLIQKEKEDSRLLMNETRMKFAAVSEKLSAWEKLQDRITLLELKLKDVTTSLERKLRLSEVLGKDDLRTFVLSLVEENLIYQTNEELQKLCQGRYEIIHQTKAMKMTPEFFILDKFREGGKRKVSTLSGGETFMVSLAMALGLAEMTRGQAEIDSLFIDEGFGTLDQDSLEDVLDMLQQIQTRGLMVGIISHIKTLTSAIPVNLMLSKKQDGTSTANLVLN